MAKKQSIARKATSHRNATKKNLIAFIKRWKDETKEEAEAKSFWDDFFQCFGIVRKEVAAFEFAVSRTGKGKGFIDLFWKGVLLVEHKSRGKSLDKAGSQAFDYIQDIRKTKDQTDLPRYVLLSDFATFRLYDLDMKADSKEEAFYEIAIEDLADNLHLFDFMSGLENHGKDIQEKELNIKAAERLGMLHDALYESNFEGHDLEVFLVRILFCLFAEDTGLFNRHQFYNFILNFTNKDGSDTDVWIHKLFQVLDKPDDKRSKNLLAEVDEFPYVNGHLFKERLELPTFDEEMREALLDCALVDWGSISPAIFGSLFQSVMDKDARRELGAHYTSETNILKLIEPLFLDDLKEEFATIQKLKQVKNKQKKLSEFQQKLTALQFFDPACGCGNFLIITYRELRRLELTVLQAQHDDSINTSLNITIEPTIKLDHFHGIEIEEFPARIAEVAMWLTQHQMNKEFSKQFGVEPELLPLTSAANIVNDNALQLDWSEVIKPEKLDYIIGNPPFVGHQWRTSQQKTDMAKVFPIKGKFGKLDFVAAWFYKASVFAKEHTTRIAFVSTNSIVQGESVGALWQPLIDKGISIDFAHRTFQWANDARGKAAVHCVIIGFSYDDFDNKVIFNYPDIKGKPEKIKVKSINPYLIDAPNIILPSRSKPLDNRPKMMKGSEPSDGGYLVISPEECLCLLKKYPSLKQWVKLYVGGRELLNNINRYCLWLVDSTAKERRELFKIPEIKKRIAGVRNSRLKSRTASVRDKAETPYLFAQIRQPQNNFLAIPRVSSVARQYIPISFLSSELIPSEKTLVVPDVEKYEFGILTSQMHMDWMRIVSGRLKNDYSYSPNVYHLYPFPDANKKQKKKIETLAQKVLDIRENELKEPDSSLADLYDSDGMSPALRKAHKVLDGAVEQCYRKEKFKNDMDRLSFLFERYVELSNANCDKSK